MATYAAFRHIELDHIGSGKRRSPNTNRGVTPPGGKCSELFVSQEDLMRVEVSTPARSKDVDTQQRLFGQDAGDDVKDGARSSGSASPISVEGDTTPIRRERNPVTGFGGKAEVTPKRRVPPGGFSSKLW